MGFYNTTLYIKYYSDKRGYTKQTRDVHKGLFLDFVGLHRKYDLLFYDIISMNILYLDQNIVHSYTSNPI